MKKAANVQDTAVGKHTEKDVQSNFETSSAQAASSLVAGGRTTLSRNSQRSKQTASVKSSGQDGALDVAIKSEHPSIRSDLPTASESKQSQALKDKKVLPN
jgi:hypothetical protein